MTIGRVVHYVPGPADTFQEERPAIVVRVWDQDSGCANLQVFTDSEDGFLWQTSVLFSADKASRTWHWPEKA